MIPLVLDWETFYDKDYSLRKMAMWDYIRDPRFKAHGVVVKLGDDDWEWWTDQLKDRLMALPWCDIQLICHNTKFDAAINNWIYQLPAPAQYCDTLALANAVFPFKDHDLDTVAALCSIDVAAKGSRLADMKGVLHPTSEQLAALGEYAIDDGKKTEGVYNRLAPLLPDEQHQIIHLITRMYAEPQCELDIPLLENALKDAETERNKLLSSVPYTKSQLSSNDKFVEILKSLGLEIPMKDMPPSKKFPEGRTIPAVAKNDLGFIQLEQAHPEHIDLFEARKSVKSTQAISRAETMLRVAHSGNGTMPMPYNYYAAHTGRPGGTDKLNVANFKRGSDLRKSIKAPKGMRIIVADSSQIEARGNSWLAGENTLTDAFHRGEDIYSQFASDIYNRPIDRKNNPDDFLPGFVGKVCILGLGYNMGPPKFRYTLAIGAMGGPRINITLAEAQDIVYNKYRGRFTRIVDQWSIFQNMLPLMWEGTTETKYGPLTFAKNCIILPNGMTLSYPNLHHDINGDWHYAANRKIYGGKMVENAIQALAWIIVSNQALEIDKEIRVIGWTYDEIIALAPENEADAALKFMIDTMSTPKDWYSDLPLAAEGGHDVCYSK